jgi:uncharacterized protein YbjQ (UPF0145 family)
LSNDDKKDLTRIEDLGEFLHELNNENESFEVEGESQGLSGLPDVPSEDFEEATPPAFGEEEAPAFDSTPDIEPETDDAPFSLSEEETDFSSDFSTGNEEPSFVEEGPAWGEEEPVTLEGSSSFEIESDSLFSDSSEEVEEVKEEEEPTTSFFSSNDTHQEFKEHKTENFDDVKKFAENSTYSATTAEANPSFSVLIRNVRFIEDAHDMASILNDLKIIQSQDDAKKSLGRGALLIPRVSEFTAVFIAHKLRRFDADILVGLSDDIHPPKHKEDAETGLVSKQNLYQNQSHSFDFSRPKIDLASIIISTAPQLDQYQVLRYLGVASEHTVLDSTIVEDETSSKIQFHYEELAHKLKAHAVKQNANAVIGINYHLTPLPQEFAMGPARYKLACTGNLVWVNRL